MKKALINPNQEIQYISSWELDQKTQKYYPIYSYFNDGLVCDVVNMEFEVAPPLYWLSCDDSVITYEYYVDKTDGLIKPIPNAPEPTPIIQPQPVTNIQTI